MPVLNPLRALAYSALLVAVPVFPRAADAPAPGKWKWEQMDNGPFFVSNLQGSNAALKTVTVKLGVPGNPEAAAVNFDTMTLRWNAAWTGGFLHLPKGRDGLEGLPEPWGAVVLSSPVGPGWARNGSFEDPRKGTGLFAPLPKDWAHWRGLYLHGDTTVLNYTVGGVEVLEVAGYEEREGLKFFSRTFQFNRASPRLVVNVARFPEVENGVHKDGVWLFEDAAKGTASGIAVFGLEDRNGRVGLLDTRAGDRRGCVDLLLNPERADQPVTVWIWTGGSRAGDSSGRFEDVARAAMSKGAQYRDLRPLTRGGPLRWGAPLVTQGRLATSGGDGPYVTDTLTPPEDNPYKSWLRFSGMDFFKDPTRAAICSVSGDVWIVSGLNDSLERLEWKRFATGLFQPLGLRIVKDTVYVTCRDGLYRLHDLNGDGEADFYENFNNDLGITPEYHEFVLGLETDRAGNFYFNKGGNLGWAKIPHHGSLIRVSKDGRKLEAVANGLRAPNGIGMGPHDEITTSDNEGNWVPACRVNLMKPGGFYGHVFTAHTATPHTNDYDGPLFWIPKNVDNSSGGQFWVTSNRWGPFEGDLLHTSYGMCSLFKCFYESVDGIEQGGLVRFPLKFDSGIMRGRFSPKDGQLYTCGLVVWQSNGAKQGAFHRVRYTGKPVTMVRDLHVKTNGVVLTFTRPLDKATVSDLENYAVDRWNYDWAEHYGSPEFSVKEPTRKGHDPVAVKSARLSPDGKTLSLELEDVIPVMQQRVKLRLKGADGADVSQEVWHTIHKVPSAKLSGS
ncbi:MAG: hypothetical protein JNL10_04390 [Verrucomicrobiales bacterium]|nr:hypothetical protein [Verrucomicrobiales bacterium]